MRRSPMRMPGATVATAPSSPLAPRQQWQPMEGFYASVAPPSSVLVFPEQGQGKSTTATRFVEVWGSNLASAMAELEYLVTQDKNHFIAVDTEFPGLVVEEDVEQAPYEKVRSNVQRTQLVQLGVSVFNGDGDCACTFQFNFSYSGLFNPSSLRMLQEAGIDLARNRSYGISHLAFGAYLARSKLLRNPNLVWICFHGCFDMAYLMQAVGIELPLDLAGFRKEQRVLFPHTMDTKQLAMGSLNFQGGLERLASQLAIQREGIAHQAGSDAKLTGDTFFKLLADHESAQERYYDTLNVIHGF